MKKYSMDSIRNYALVGASGSGKTSIAEAMFFNAGVINRLGRVDEGNTLMDYDPDEVSKQMSINLSLGNLEWKKVKHNVVDTPGYSDFKGDMITAFRATDTALVTISAVNGIEVMTDQAMKYADEVNNSKAIIINKLDREHAKFTEIIDELSSFSDQIVVPVLIPIGTAEHFKGVVNTINKKAYAQGKEIEIPANLADEVEEWHEKVIEAAAESDDKLMEKFFEEGALSAEEISLGLKNSIMQGTAIPVFACSASENIGIQEILNLINMFFPSPHDIKEIPVQKKDEIEKLDLANYKKKLGYVIKSVTELNFGEIALVRMYSGVLNTGDEVELPEKAAKEKIGQIFSVCGKKRDEVDELSAGDIGGLVKLKNTKTSNTIAEKGENLIIKPLHYPEPVYWKSIRAASQSDEDRIGPALTKITDEDPTIKTEINIETNQNILSGQGEIQIGIVQKRLKDKYNVEANLTDPKIPYKETVTGKSDVKYRHKKQSGGHGQYGEVYIRVSPKELGEGFEFVNAIVGGVIPSKYIPAVEKGLIETMKDGILAGYPVVDIQVELYYGSYHDVDSSEMAFKIAASHALKDGFAQANPILLEPIHKVQIVVPTEYMGDVMGDISSRRGKILGMSQEDNKQILNAEIPLSELYSYYTSLKSITQGRGYFTQQFAYYQKLPNDQAQKVISESKKDEE